MSAAAIWSYWIPRQIQEDMEFAGLKLKKGKTVLLGLASANRDPTIFRNPDEFIPTRKPNPHIGFGFGIHHCLCAHTVLKPTRPISPEQ